ncbi:MAG TPA: Na/Pi cotransporter family protein [Anaerolineae bacterium]|jgi:phosphate:Na+ symporter|nr:Na/Pi cotransporter family protein [Anaerolineae bacterium]
MTETVDWVAIIIGLFGGLAIFLFGMEIMTAGLKNVAGSRMKDLLGKWTTNKWKAVGAGAVITAIIQSSSVTTVTTVGFVSSGLMTLEQAMGVIMGANIGTTITAHLVAFDIVQFAFVLAILGFGLMSFSKKGQIKQVGLVLMGLGLLFIGMELMGLAMEPLAEYEPFVEAMSSLERILPAMIVGAVFTALVQSSSATIGIVVAMAGQGLITLETGIALVLGANIGTSVTAVLGSLGQSREAQQTAAFHVIFNTVGALIWIPFIDQLASICTQIAPDDLARQIAWSTTIFNVANTFIFIWFTAPLARLVRRLVPDRPEAEIPIVEPKYLEEDLLDKPALALDRVRLELERTSEYTLEVVDKAVPVVSAGSEEELAELATMAKNLESLHGAVISYLRKLAHQQIMNPELTQLAVNYLTTANYLQNISNMVKANLVSLGRDRLSQDVQVSKETAKQLTQLQEQVSLGIDQSVNSLLEKDDSQAKAVYARLPELKQQTDEIETRIALRLTADEPNRVATYRLETEIIENLKNMYFVAMRIANMVAPQREALASI